ncbi:Dynein-1-beta heavy chain [Diplonema papillatum]|nr:Dynein-1-beta heavy chain [Diplonema papillatum]
MTSVGSRQQLLDEAVQEVTGDDSGEDDDELTEKTVVHPECLAWMKGRILEGLDVPSTSWTDAHSSTVAYFLGAGCETVQNLFVLTDAEQRLYVCTHAPVRRSRASKDGVEAADLGDRAMFFCKSTEDEIQPFSIDSAIHFLVVHGSALDSLLRTVQFVVAPSLLRNKGWPESIQKEFSTQIHKFLASLTENANRIRGKTVLYVPLEEVADAEAAAHNKDLVQRFEAALIHWTRQIKDVLAEKDQVESSGGDSDGPLAEIAFWRARATDLNNILGQLERADVRLIVRVLSVAKSVYLEQFEKLAGLIRDGTEEAKENLLYLRTLQEPCEQLRGSKTREVPNLLHPILSTVQLIFLTSPCFNTPERLVGILRRVSNEIISRCRSEISLDAIFQASNNTGTTNLREEAKAALVDATKAGESWKSICKKMLDATEKKYKCEHPSVVWETDSTNQVFAEIEAFISQRCRDLLEVCENQQQFGMKKEDEMPCFAGVRGPEILKSLVDIQRNFERHISQLRNLPYAVLDVKQTFWHDDYARFKKGVRDLETMLTNIISSSFDLIPTIESGVELLEAFSFLAERDSVKRAVERKADGVFGLFLAELTVIKNWFNDRRKNPPVPEQHPPEAGRALWAYNFKTRIDSHYRLLSTCHYLPSNLPHREESFPQYHNLSAALEQYIQTTFNEWRERVESQKDILSHHLDVALLTKVHSETYNVLIFECSFSPDLLRLLDEIRLWTRQSPAGLGMTMSAGLQELQIREEKLRVFRENICLAVRAYNTIVTSLTSEERRLFAERTAFLDSKYNPGISKLLWSSKGIVEYFVRDCTKYAAQVQKVVDTFKRSVLAVRASCQTIASTLLVKIQKKYTYLIDEFERVQAEHRVAVRAKLKQTHEQIVETLNVVFEDFKRDYVASQEVRDEWRIFVDKVEKEIDDALRQTVKRSLQEISRAIIGDAKAGDPGQLFQVSVVLDGPRPELQPGILQLSQIINNVSKELITVITVIPRLESSLRPAIREALGEEEDPNAEEPPHADSFYEIISHDNEILKVMVQIMTGMSTIQEDVTKYLYLRWEKYDQVHTVDKDAYTRRFARGKREMWSFDQEIQKYKDQISLIQNEETTTTIKFLRVECLPLKATLNAHCQEWMVKIYQLLNSMAVQELNALYDYFSTNKKRVLAQPTGLDMLGEQLAAVQKIRAEESQIEARFKPVKEQYGLLEKCEVSIPEQELTRLTGLDESWMSFKKSVVEAKRKLDKEKDRFKQDLEQEMKGFDKSVGALLDEFATKGPYDGQMTPTAAFAMLEKYREKLHAKRDKESSLRQGMEIFHIDRPPYEDLKALSTDVELLQSVWKLTDDWHKQWSLWENDQLQQLQLDDINDELQRYNKQIAGMRKTLEKKGVWLDLKAEVDRFRKTLPLLTHLRNSALRPRHWEQLMDEVDHKFDPWSAEFTLQKVDKLNLNQHPEFIENLSNSATQEQSIERGLAKVKTAWDSTSFKIDEYRQYYKITAVDDITQQLEDHLAILSNMKVSRFVAAFAADVQYWEQSLSIISDTMEALLQVQTKWMYLENIFVGSEDIQKKLPTETSMFLTVNSQWKTIMARFKEDPNVCRGTTKREGLLDTLNDMLRKLEKIQKQLEDYLEDRRRVFPRFYFLSNDDLLEILGHSREPRKVLPHLKKCFEGVHGLEFADSARKGGGIVAKKMIEAGGEAVDFLQPVQVEGEPVEHWLGQVEEAMRVALRRYLWVTYENLKAKPKDLAPWLKDHFGQLLITSASINWTSEVDKTLRDVYSGTATRKNPIRYLFKKWRMLIDKWTDIVRGNMPKLARNKLVSLITIEVHNRDILDNLQREKVSSPNDFAWSSQLRYFWVTDEKDQKVCQIRMASAQVWYDYEYEGNNGRLVVTALTDRAYMTLTTALQLQRGGLPQGPAGTGKTETVKDLGKGIAKYVIVFNCSDGLDYQSMGRMFSGLAQTGAWSCFDEFNRIEVEVLSVVAQQILCILSAVKEKKAHFIFENFDIPLNLNVGIFVTMNPSGKGYAGRSELPDNLKALLRPISMMTPDFALICEITLLSVGFQDSRVLGHKVTLLYDLMDKQLSKQNHYDCSLRNIKAVLVQAGKLKREALSSASTSTEEQLCLKACSDMNLPKFVKEDVPLFLGMLQDLFPSVEPDDAGLDDLKIESEATLIEKDMVVSEHVLTKVMHLYDTMNTRHGVMVVGETGSGKTVVWQTMASAFKRLKEQGKEGWEPVKVYIINPKAVLMDELYGSYNLASREWKDGIASSIMKTICAQDTLERKWMLFDGPVDTKWIESMNTVLDDNKMLTLINGDRISLTPQITILFEVADLSQASPATVSRCGIVFFNYCDLGWTPYFETWVKERRALEIQMNAPKPDATVKLVTDLFMGHVQRGLDYRARELKELFTTSEIHTVRSLTHIFDAVASVEGGLDVRGGGDPAAAPQVYLRDIQMLWIFSLVWSIGGSLRDESRPLFDVGFARDLDSSFPSSGTTYDYFVDLRTHQWRNWDEKVSAFTAPPGTNYFKLIVPTVDTVRYSFLVTHLVRTRRHVVLTGNTGTGKSIIAGKLLAELPANEYALMTMNFSAQTSSQNVQDIVEGKMDKKSKKNYTAPNGKRLICLIEDLNMPAKDKFGSQPPLELLRLWIDNGFWYDRTTQSRRQINDLQLLCNMTFGRPDISTRLMSRLVCVNITFPTDSVMQHIFSNILNHALAPFDEFQQMIEDLVRSTMEIYKLVTTDPQTRPIPSKSHYLFNLRDLSKVFQGINQADHEALAGRDGIIILWLHECQRVFQDRMNNADDKNWFKMQLESKLESVFASKWKTLLKDGRNPIFVDFMEGEFDENAMYREVPEMATLKQRLEERLDEHNEEPGSRPMHLVFFSDAIEHICHINRILRQPRGNALLVGVGGSGRRSLTRMAAYLAGYQTFSIEITKNYKSNEFHEDLKKLYQSCGMKKQSRVFVFSDTQISEASFLEDINNMLSSGEVPNLFANDEKVQIKDEVRRDATEAGVVDASDGFFQFFIDRARTYLHLVICLSPVGDAFRVRLRMFPSLINCTTLDWFMEWPNDALKEVAKRFISDIDLGAPERVDSVSDVFVLMHSSVHKASKTMATELKRYNYVTPTNYLELVSGYCKVLTSKRESLGVQRDKLINGIKKLDDTEAKVSQMSDDLQIFQRDLDQKSTDCEAMMRVITQEKKQADERRAQVEHDKTKIGREKDQTNQIAMEAQADLDRALPELLMAEEALKTLDKSDINEMKAYNKPPEAVQTCMAAVQTVLRRPTSWDEAKKTLGDATFLRQLLEYDKEQLTDRLLGSIAKFTNLDSFKPQVVGKVSSAAKGLCMWTIAMHSFGLINKEVVPKKLRLQKAQSELQKKEDMLASAIAQLDEMNQKVAELEKQMNERLDEKNRLQLEAEKTEAKLKRAEQLVSGLGSERERWTSSTKTYELGIENLIGDSMLASGILSYIGSFTGEFRDELQVTWRRAAATKKDAAAVPMSKSFDFIGYYALPTEIREWELQGLPGDDFSTMNGVLVMRGERWPLMIDPQGQANKWIKNMEKDKGLKVIDLKQADFLRTIEHAVQLGTPVLIQDVSERLDPSLDSILSRAIVKQGGRNTIKIGDNVVDYNDKFKLYLTTKNASPHYSPEICTKVTLVNCAVKDKGLEEQLLKIVVAREQKELEEQNDELVVSTAEYKRLEKELEDKILKLLSEADDSLLDDVNLIDTLQTSKQTATNIATKLKEGAVTAERIKEAREQYRDCAQRASVLYFVLSDLCFIDNMYQFALDAYVHLFEKSIKGSSDVHGMHGRTEPVASRVKLLNDWHTRCVYDNTCRALFERHKLLFSLHMTASILMKRKDAAENGFSIEEYAFFIKGGTVLDKESRPPNPGEDWLEEKAWDNIVELDKLVAFHGIVSSFESSPSDWKRWYMHPLPDDPRQPEDDVGEWTGAVSEWLGRTSPKTMLQRMVIVRSVRPDRVVPMVRSFIEENLDKKFVEPPAFNLTNVYRDSAAVLPLVFVLSPGVDPMDQLRALADKQGRLLKALALGQGQASTATRMIHEQAKQGGWVFLQNCHLMLKWLPTLEKIIDDLPAQKPNENFRLWLSSIPHPSFPIGILQKAIKMTTEPPTGLKSNLIRLYNLVTEEQFGKATYRNYYRPLLFSLCFFHAVLLERKKFGSLGYNVDPAYDFNDSDFQVSEAILSLYINEMEEPSSASIPFPTIRYLICDASYGGRVTDDWDRRTLKTYMNQYLCMDAVLNPQYKLSSDTAYYIPSVDGTLSSYKEYVQVLPGEDPPTAFGQHSNADIMSQILRSNDILDCLLTLNATLLVKVSGGSGGGDAAVSVERVVLGLVDQLEAQVPGLIDIESIAEAKADDPDEAGALTTCLLQEISRYNILLAEINYNLREVKRGVSGLVIMNDTLDQIFQSLLFNKVPDPWEKHYPTLKPLSSWFDDLKLRIDQMQSWGRTMPKVFWLSGFTYPTGFLKAVQQAHGRKNGISIDQLGWEFTVLDSETTTITQSAREGTYIRGIYLEGAGWNGAALCEPEPMALTKIMPFIHFRPVIVKKTGTKGKYNCPTYMYPIRTGTRERPSFVVTVVLPSGKEEPEHWIKRGTALLLSTDA